MRLRHALVTIAGTTILVGVPSTAAFAQAYPGGTTEERVLSEQQDRSDEVLGTTETRGQVLAAEQTLPVTGGDIAGLAILGVSLVGVGTVVVRRTRRTAPVTA